MIDKAILSVVLTVLLISLTVAVMLLIVPLYHRIEFDQLCQAQLMRMEAAGGSTDEQIGLFKADLTAAGFRVVRLSATPSAPFGGELVLHVEATRDSRQIRADLSMKEVRLSLTFQRSVLCRKIVTDAGEPLAS